MHRTSLTLLWSSLLCAVASAGSIGINFGDATTTSTGWNNAGAIDGAIDNLTFLDGSLSGIRFDISDEFLFNGTNGSGITDPGEPAASYFPGDVTNTSYYGNTELWGNSINAFVQFTLSDLQPGTSYQSTFYAIRTGCRGQS